jgi:hypothetical protein
MELKKNRSLAIVVSKLRYLNKMSQKLTEKIDYKMRRELFEGINMNRTFTASCSEVSCAPTSGGTINLSIS